MGRQCGTADSNDRWGAATGMSCSWSIRRRRRETDENIKESKEEGDEEENEEGIGERKRETARDEVSNRTEINQKVRDSIEAMYDLSTEISVGNCKNCCLIFASASFSLLWRGAKQSVVFLSGYTEDYTRVTQRAREIWSKQSDRRESVEVGAATHRASATP